MVMIGRDELVERHSTSRRSLKIGHWSRFVLPQTTRPATVTFSRSTNSLEKSDIWLARVGLGPTDKISRGELEPGVEVTKSAEHSTTRLIPVTPVVIVTP